MSDDETPPGRPGRPSRCEIDAIRAKTWFWAVANRVGAQSGYALEKHFSPKRMQRSNGVTKRPCKFDKYRRGEHSPRPALIKQIDEEMPGTAVYADHCFWRVAKWPPIELDELHHHLASLRPDIVDLLFYPQRGNSQSRERRPREYADTFQRLKREGDWDALTACIGVIQEAKHYGEEFAYPFYTWSTFAVFRRLIARSPFYEVSDELFDYLMRHILDNPDGDEIAGLARSIDIREFARLTTHRTLLIEDLYLLKKFGRTPISCMHIAERYLPPSVLHHIDELAYTGQWKRIRQLPEIRNLSRALQRWEAKQPARQVSPTRTGQ